ncbi:hypothetical protein FKP32DRAFT_1672210 [Trametes sanguinea]|nr:hypothetical protein FKP32DRAFT_1672210 [Trametes sanguinea]
MAFVIPRTAVEWSKAFSDATPTSTISVLGHPPRGSFSVKIGDYVTIKPDGSRRDDIHIQEEEWIARVRALATSEALGPLVKLKWFIQSGDLLPRQCSDAFTTRYFTLAGTNELFPLRHQTVTHANAIHDLIQVEEFDPTIVSLRVFNHDTLYYRSNYFFERVNNSDFYRITADTAVPLCTTSDCTYHRQYCPDNHIMRYCELCSTWYHIQCIKQSDARAPTLLPRKPPTNPAPSLPSIPIPEESISQWRSLLRYPIQRGTHQISWLLSFETLVFRIRFQDASHGCPLDVHSFLIANIPLAPHLAHFLDTFLTIFLNQPPNPKYYQCPMCFCDI